MARQIKRSIKRRYDEVEPKILESVLTRIDGEHSIHLNKNEVRKLSTRFRLILII